MGGGESPACGHCKAAVHGTEPLLESRRGSLHFRSTCESRMPVEGAAREGGGAMVAPAAYVRSLRPSWGSAGRNCKGTAMTGSTPRAPFVTGETGTYPVLPLRDI